MIKRFLAAASFLILGVTAANASTLLPGTRACDVNEPGSFGVTLDGGTYIDCAGSYVGNDSELNYQNYINDDFGTTGTWSELAKAEDSNSWVDGGLEFTSGEGARIGGFTLSGFIGDAVIVVKGSNCFSAFYFSGISGTVNGTFDTDSAGLNTGNSCNRTGVPGISHLTVYTVAAIPVPAAGFMLLLGLGGLAAVRRRKSAS